jgi:hypothetical protein
LNAWVSLNLTYIVMIQKFKQIQSGFFLPHFLGAPKSEWLLLPKRAAALSEGTQWCKGGTGKGEAAKLPGAGISLKQCPEK